MDNRWVLLLCVFGSGACPTSVDPHFEVDQTFEYVFFEGEACEEAITQGVNCSAIVSFCADGTTYLLSEDALDLGTYERTDGRIDASYDLFGDIGFSWVDGVLSTEGVAGAFGEWSEATDEDGFCP